MTPFQELLQTIDAAKADLDGLRPLAREQEARVMQKFRLWWTYHSNAIEGNSLSQGETEMFLMEGLTAKGKPLKDHLDLRGHSDAINYLLDCVRDQEVLTEAAIRKLHEVLLVEPYRVPAVTPDGAPTTKAVALGQYKTQPNHVQTPTGEIHYYATPEETPAKMQELMTWYREQTAKKEMHPVEIAARFHHRFTQIHPFDDGNGRMSRLLMNLLLMQAGYPPAVIRIGERNQYLAALRRADAGEDDDFLVFVAEHVASALDLFIRAAKGEEIHEPSDLEKEIAILKIELKHAGELQPLSADLLKRTYDKSLGPLFAEVLRLLTPLSELFTTSLVRSTPVINGRSYPTDLSLREFEHRFHPEDLWVNGTTPEYHEFQFHLIRFKKARFDAFDLAESCYIEFEPLKYLVVFNDFRVEHSYQENLSSEEVSKIAAGIVRFFLDEIKKRVGGAV